MSKSSLWLAFLFVFLAANEVYYGICFLLILFFRNVISFIHTYIKNIQLCYVCRSFGFNGNKNKGGW